MRLQKKKQFKHLGKIREKTFVSYRRVVFNFTASKHYNRVHSPI